MKNSIVYFLLILVLLFSGDLIRPAFGQIDIKQQKKPASDFVLEDQFKKKQEIKFPSDKDRVLIFFKMQMGNESYHEVIEWKSHFESHFRDSIEVYLIGIHTKVPFFIRSMIRGFMDEKERILLDWGGKVAEKYDYQNEAKVIYVSRDGLIRSTARGTYTEKKLKTFILKNL